MWQETDMEERAPGQNARGRSTTVTFVQCGFRRPRLVWDRNREAEFRGDATAETSVTGFHLETPAASSHQHETSDGSVTSVQQSNINEGSWVVKRRQANTQSRCLQITNYVTMTWMTWERPQTFFSFICFLPHFRQIVLWQNLWHPQVSSCPKFL